MVTIRQATKKDYGKLIEIMNKATDKELRGFVPIRDVIQNFLNVDKSVSIHCRMIKS